MSASRSSFSSRALARGVLAAFFVSGFCGLVHEVVWTRLLRLVMGNTTHAVTTVLCAFMGGLALGSFIGGRAAEPRAANETYQTLLSISPDFLPALNNLAWILAANPDGPLRDAAGAARLAERCELTAHEDADRLDTLAVAYAAAGRFADTRAATRKALELAAAGGLDRLAAEIQARLGLFEQDRAYRDPPGR
ncbi:MAG: hypothetical protein HY812_11960 [Planctomycetes bacterium]|nr:hypothetical protein [Planctomycetota bacterium]